MRQNKKKSTSSPNRIDLERSAWEAILRKQTQMKFDKIPPGWINYEQFAEKMGVCREVAELKLRQLARAGLCERKEFKVLWECGGGRVPTARFRPYFKVKQ